jgi:hypothetical protein
VSTLEKIGTTLRLLLSPTTVRLVVVTEDDFLLAFAALDAARLCVGTRAESKANHEIYLETTVPLVAGALSSTSSASHVSIKLIQRAGQAFLSFEVTDAGSNVTVIQDVPVTVLPASDAPMFAEPRIPPPEVSLIVRDTRSLRAVTDRMKSLGKFVSWEAATDGTLSIALASDVVTVKTFYRNLVPHGVGPAGDARACVRVDARRLSKVLSACHALPGHLLACTQRVLLC